MLVVYANRPVIFLSDYCNVKGILKTRTAAILVGDTHIPSDMGIPHLLLNLKCFNFNLFFSYLSASSLCKLASYFSFGLL